jgi:hypothetical protein
MPGIRTLTELSVKIDEKHEEILNDWKQSRNLPRKQKKLKKKHLLLDFSINEWAKSIMPF